MLDRSSLHVFILKLLVFLCIVPFIIVIMNYKSVSLLMLVRFAPDVAAKACDVPLRAPSARRML